MAPAITIENTSDFDLPTATPAKATQKPRTLLLSPPSLAAHPELLNKIFESHDRSSTDVQMLDRLNLGVATLPENTYDDILILNGADGYRDEADSLINRGVLAVLAKALILDGKLRSQDDNWGLGEERTEGVLAGLICIPMGGMIKPDPEKMDPVPLRRKGKKSKKHGKERSKVKTRVEDDADDADLIDEDELMKDEDPNWKPAYAMAPAECVPRAKKRRACADCTCGLAERLNAENKAIREGTATNLSTLKLGASDLAEVDFTVKGKVGSCGSCALGDAFRCDGCPYTGLPPFKPGEEVKMLEMDMQL